MRAEIVARRPRRARRGRDPRPQGRNRILANKQSVTRRRDLAEHLRVTVFAPDDLALVKGAPGAAGATSSTTCSVASTPRIAGGDHRLRARA